MRLRTAAALAAVLSLTLAGCFPTARANNERPAAQEQPAKRPDNCLTADPGAIAKLTEHIAATTNGAKILRTGLVRSTDSDMWMLAVEFNDGAGDYTGVWGSLQDLTSNPDPAFVAVDEVAEVSADYLQPKDFDKIGSTLPTAIAATDCLA